LLGILLVLSYKTIASSTNLLIVQAQVFKKRLIQQYRVDPSKIVVIPHGVESRGPSRPSRAEVLDRSDVVLCFGVISPRKGLESLLSAFGLLLKRRDGCKLLLAGSSPPYYRGYEMKLKDLASQLGLGSHVEFLGFVSNDKAHRLFDNAKAIVLPYSYDVSASGALSWALGHALPIIASDNEYFREELSHSQFGLLTSSGDKEGLAQAMETMLVREDLWEVFSRHAREVAQSRSWLSVASMTVEAYRKLIGRSKA
jgi:glycosyltransferase involved in cell wall biosynthesis